MFSDSQIKSTGFTVTAETIKQEDEAGCQTDVLASAEKDTQTIIFKDSSTQTDTKPKIKKIPDCDDEKLAKFLNKVYPHLMQELDENNWSCQLNKHDAAHDEPVVNLHNIESEILQDKVVSCLSWNSTGMSLAICFCEPIHESWCTHEGQVHVYNTGKTEFFNLPPDYVFNTDSCPKCISFHPTKPSLLVCGRYNGEILVWDLKEDDIFSVGVPNDNFPGHSDVITNITWIFDGVYFVTSGKDGLIIIWKIVMKKIEPHKKFFISSEYCNPGRSVINDHAEILSLGFWRDPKESDFIVATGGGNIFHCSSESKENIPLKPGFSDPVLMKYSSHSGIITCVKCSSNNKFATCGTDSEIHIYSSREKTPLHIIHSEFPLFGIEWIGNNSDVIFCWGSSPSVHFYKTSTKEKIDTYTIALKNSTTEIVATNLNKQRRGVIAIGTNKGGTSIWMIPHGLHT